MIQRQGRRQSNKSTRSVRFPNSQTHLAILANDGNAKERRVSVGRGAKHTDAEQNTNEPFRRVRPHNATLRRTYNNSVRLCLPKRLSTVATASACAINSSIARKSSSLERRTSTRLDMVDVPVVSGQKQRRRSGNFFSFFFSRARKISQLGNHTTFDGRRFFVERAAKLARA